MNTLRDFLGLLQDGLDIIELLWERDLRHSWPLHFINGLIFATAITLLRHSGEGVWVTRASIAFWFVCVAWIFYGFAQIDRYVGRS